MSRELQARLGLDLIMVIFLLCAFAYHIIGDAVHEWIGVALSVLFIVHNIINWRWNKNIFNGKYNAQRIIMTVINMLLILIMTVIVITGLLHSRTVLAFLHLSGGMFLRQIHTTAAYWSLILVAAHISLHGTIIFGVVRKMINITSMNRSRFILWHIFKVALIVYGLWAFLDRDMAAKLFMGYSFDFWNPDRPTILFFTNYLTILCLYIVGIRGLLKLMVKFKISTDNL